ncbi:MAG: hypothetical protein Q8N18_01890 [Opitutaceae bacterium]|nr:hypothetical protein [Opitutaceae bacterium]
MKTVILSLAALLAFSGTLQSATPNRGKASLTGLKGVFVVVSSIDQAARKDGLLESRVREVTEAALRAANIPIRTQPEAADGDANLVITIDTIKHPQGPYLFSVSVALVQMVRLTRSPSGTPIPAETWGAKGLGLTSPARMDIIEEPLKEKLGEFISTFRSANQQ